HCDGHHKLIWWGIVLHGFIDGYCHTVRHYDTLCNVDHATHKFLRSQNFKQIPTTDHQQS
ncbi:hypothetical protein BDY19DRAFT_892184, partial [Irpex rosettiformis]